MTMLDRMRRHKNWLKWSLALVCLTFVVFYIPSFLRTDTSAANTADRVASVDARSITVAEFRRRYLAQVNAYRQSYGGNLSDAVLQQLQVPQQVLQQIIEENAEIAEAEKMGITASDEEVRKQIMSIPGLQENGRFIGENRYRALLRAQDPPMTPEQIRASHILLKTEGKNDADVKAKAEGILKEAKAGGDFAALAKKYSEDDSNAQQGGDLDYFTRGRMVPEFDTAAFALAPGEVSGLVKTQFGYHIIKVTDRKPAITRDLKEAALYKEIELQVQHDQAEVQVNELADGLAREGTTPPAFEKAAASRGLKVEESG